MAQTDPTSALLLRNTTRIRQPTIKFIGAQEGRILSASTTEAMVVVPAYSTVTPFGPAPLPMWVTEAPAAGTRCLVEFAKAVDGTYTPWVVSLTTVELG